MTEFDLKNPEKTLFIGVDGGATKCIARVENAYGKPLSQGQSGPCNIRISVNQAWQSITDAISRALEPLNISLDEGGYECHVGMGVAGCEVMLAYQTFLKYPHPFASLAVTHDSHTACLGAHGGNDGAMIIAGTGVVGYQIENGESAKVSGWGFPHDDVGSGAWLGLEATRITLQSQDGRMPQSGISRAVMAHFGNNFDRLVAWANQANSTAYAELAPLVTQQAQAGDADAIDLLKHAAHALDAVASALQIKRKDRHQPLPCALVGGVAPFIKPYLSEALKARLVPCQLTPDAGAILFIRQTLVAKQKERA